MQFEEFVAQFLAERQRVLKLDWALPVEPEGPPPFHATRLQPLATRAATADLAVQSVAEVRRELPFVVANYAYDQDGEPGALLLRVPAGVGKTHALVKFAQVWAKQSGARVLWAAGAHSAWDDIQALRHADGSPLFDPDAWFHWQGITRVDEVTGEPLCRYAAAQEKWARLGYKAWDLCWRLCAGDGHLAECPFRQQANTKRRCILGMHNHLTTGISLSDFTLAIVDELPLGAFVDERFIPASGMLVQARGPLATLLIGLKYLVGTLHRKQFLAARELFEARVPIMDGGTVERVRIGDLLGDVFAQLEVFEDVLPKVPFVGAAEDVFDLDYWYVQDLLLLAVVEYEAWRAGWTDWAHRWWLSGSGLHMIRRAEVWDKLPLKRVILDATGRAGLYQMLFNDTGIAQVYSPDVPRVGRWVQVAGRLNSKRQLYKIKREIDITANGKRTRKRQVETTAMYREGIQIMAALADQHDARVVGLVCYLDIEEEARADLEALGYEVKTRHFNNLRGTNVFIKDEQAEGGIGKIDVLFVWGTPSPRFADVVNIATALDPERRRPFGELDPDSGKLRPLYSQALREFRLTPAALADAKARGIAKAEAALVRATTPEQVRQAEADLQAWQAAQAVARRVGVYWDAELDHVQGQLREAELAQAGHRSRGVTENIPTYLLTATPTGEVLDQVLDDPPIGPPEIAYKTWLKIWPNLAQAHIAQTEVAMDDIAAWAWVDRSYVSRQQWLPAIARHLPYLWEFGASQAQTGRGRRRLVLLPVDGVLDA